MVTGMIPEKAQEAELSRGKLQALVLQLMDRVRELEEQLRVKRPPLNSKNSSQPPSRDFKSDKQGAVSAHEKTVLQNSFYVAAGFPPKWDVT